MFVHIKMLLFQRRQKEELRLGNDRAQAVAHTLMREQILLLGSTCGWTARSHTGTEDRTGVLPASLRARCGKRGE